MADDSTLGAKIMAFSAAGMLLGLGLCGAGGVAYDHGVPFAENLLPVGTLFFCFGGIMLLIGLVLFLTARTP